jgi:hypothetical protein
MPEWIAAPLVHSFFQSTKLQDRLKVATPKGKTLNCKALTCLWTTVKKNTKEHQAVLMKARLNDVGWKTTSGKIRNEQHDGHIEDRSTCLIAANREIINRLPEQFAESNDGVSSPWTDARHWRWNIKRLFHFLCHKQQRQQTQQHGSKH